jgi:glycosyltransferase involved in cell wall biosynthesis
MKITVILCTYNRAQSLPIALESVAASTFTDPVEWDVLVVDNNSKDQTRQVVEDFCRRYPGRFSYLFEPKAGKSFALNTGIRESKGDILAFMDDDVTVDSNWLQNLCAPLNDSQWAGSGGRILPPSGFSPPKWLALTGPYDMGGVLALFDRGASPCEIDWPPYGTNMAFRKEMFKKHGGFREDLGPTPGSELRNEDTEFGWRVMRGGDRIRYEPSAIVYHPVPKERLKKKYFLTWRFDYGRAEVRVDGKKPEVWIIPPHYTRIANRVLRKLPARLMSWMFATDPQRRFFYKCWVWMTAGEIVEIRRIALSQKSANKA